MDLDLMLDYGDAEFVEIVHTNGGGIGLPGKWGHIDFYPDGGSTQAKCSSEIRIFRFSGTGKIQCFPNSLSSFYLDYYTYSILQSQYCWEILDSLNSEQKANGRLQSHILGKLSKAP